MKNNRIPTDGGLGLSQNDAFASLDSLRLPQGPSTNNTPAPTANKPSPKANTKGRVDLRRLTAGKGGKTVTAISGLTILDGRSREALLHTLKQSCGCGGTLKADTIELQGDQRDAAEVVLKQEGFKVVRAGG